MSEQNAEQDRRSPEQRKTDAAIAAELTVLAARSARHYGLAVAEALRIAEALPREIPHGGSRPLHPDTDRLRRAQIAQIRSLLEDADAAADQASDLAAEADETARGTYTRPR